MSFINKRWNNISIARRLYIVIAVMAALIVFEMFVLSFAMKTLSGVRAFVGEESIWSKSQKNSIIYLHRYEHTHDELDYKLFVKSFTIAKEAHRGKAELEKTKPDFTIVKDAFLSAHFNSGDVDPVIFLFQNFRGISYLENAIKSWEKGDELLSKYENAGIEYHQLIFTNSNDKKKLDELRTTIFTLNDELTIEEESFSHYLSAGSQWFEKTINLLLCIIVSLTEIIGLILTFITARYISKKMKMINAAAEKIGRGNFDTEVNIQSLDEVGTLSNSVNNLRILLSQSHQDLEKKILLRTKELNELLTKNLKLNIEANEAIRMRDQFISIASHELKTPLATLQLQLQFINRSLQNPEQGDPKVFSDASLVQVQRLDRLINELLDLARIRSGKLDLQLVYCNLSQIVTEYALALNPDAEKKGSTITINTKPSIMGFFDSMRIGQAIINLVSNAIKYGNGSPIEIIVDEKDAFALIQVKDRGPGIPADKLNLIFQCYERANIHNDIPGFGLGLYITKEIVSAHRGTITVDSALGKGSTFLVRLPLKMVAS